LQKFPNLVKVEIGVLARQPFRKASHLDKKGGETPTFSDKAIGFIRSLEKRYIR
jgi:hypothetical protein